MAKMQYIATMKQDRTTDLDKLVHLAGSQRRLAAVLGMTEENVSRWRSGRRNVPAYVSVVVELLEAVPPKDWPERWKNV